MKLLIIIFFVSLANGSPIIMGSPSTQMLPYLVSVRRNGITRCGGSILDETTILTAAHCLETATPDILSIGVGSTKLDGQITHEVLSFTNHESYGTGGFNRNYDVAIIKLKTSIILKSGLAEKVKLSTSCPDLPYGKVGLTAGWGRTQVNVKGPVNDLEEIRLKVLKDSDPGCKPYNDYNKLSDTMFCAGNDDASGDTAQGDSGGPLTVVNEKNGATEQIGIVSWAVAVNAKLFAGVYTNICKVKSWIDQNKK